MKSNLLGLLYLFFISTLFVDAQNYEEQYLKDKSHTASGLGIHGDLAYGSYLVEVDSSEMNSAIDYSVIEATLGLSYVYGSWMWGVYGKFLVDEVYNNMYVVTTQKKLSNQAKIEKKEFALYTNYTLFRKEQTSWRLNLIYRESRLNAKDDYNSFNNYESFFYYQTKGLALSLVYATKFNKRDALFMSLGILHSRAEVKISERVNRLKQDAFIEDDSSATGVKVSFGYSHNFSNRLIFTLRSDAWWLNFSKLKVQSQVGDSLPRAKLKEQTISSYMGLTWRF
jgi:hypothetical protein